MTDNVLAAIAGQFSPTAFTPTLRPQGNPVTQGGLRQLQSLANTGGWEGFMAQQMLPTEYGGGGMSASQAKGALIKAIRAPDTADQTALDLREELRGSLTPRYETSARPGDTPVNKDLSTAQGIANAYDLTDLDAVARQWQSDLAKDPIAAYTDPQTGLSYAGVTSANTPTMDWFDKYGLPYANGATPTPTRSLPSKTRPPRGHRGRARSWRTQRSRGCSTPTLRHAANSVPPTVSWTSSARRTSKRLARAC